MHNYHSTHGTFPLGGTYAAAYGPPPTGYNTGWGTWSAQALMLSYLEQTPLYNAANFSWAAGYGPGWLISSTVTSAVVNSFLCPSDGQTPFDPPALSTGNAQWGGRINNYFFSVGTTTAYPGSADTTGVFTQGFRAYGVQHITDGTSNTIAFGESVVGPGGPSTSVTGPTGIFRNGINVPPPSITGGLFDVSSNVVGVLSEINTCQTLSLNPTIKNQDDKGARWAEDDGGFSLINTVVPPSSPQYSFACCSYCNCDGCDDGLYQNANSMHPGGANFLFADGSVRFIKSSIAIKTYWALGTKANGEVISSDSY
jgi:prepilin-type processing-associated H-X9-DG protein